MDFFQLHKKCEKQHIGILQYITCYKEKHNDNHTLVSIVLSMTEPIPAALLKLWYWVSVRPVQVNACTILERINQETETAVNIKKAFERHVQHNLHMQTRNLPTKRLAWACRGLLLLDITIKFFQNKRKPRQKMWMKHLNEKITIIVLSWKVWNLVPPPNKEWCK